MLARSALAVYAAALLLALAVGGAVAQVDVGSIITQSMFDSMLPNRNSFYTYDAFIAAAKTFPGFGTTGGDQLVRRELAAFFGQTSHETTGGGSQGGYTFIEQINKPDRPYYGRGPIQLTGVSNYRAAGAALNQPLESSPDLVSTDPVVSFRTALWFWMTPQSPKPSCHDVVLGNWTPTDADRAAGRLPGYGVITNIINGGAECGKGQLAQDDPNADRIAYYRRYCDMLGTTYGDNLDCYSQHNFATA